MTIGEGFRDDLGFVRRTGVTRQFYDAAWMPQPESLRRARHPAAAAARARVELQRPARRSGHAARPRGDAGDLGTTARTSIRIRAARRGHHDAVRHLIRASPSRPAATTGRSTCSLFEGDHSRALSGSARVMLGDFWSGTQRTMQASVLYRPTYRMVFDLGLQVSDIDLQVPQAVVRQHARQPAQRLFVQLEHVSRLARAVSDRRQAVFRERALQPDSPAVERLLHRLQRVAVHRHDADGGARPRREVHPDVSF